VNASLPRDADPESLTVDAAVALLAERAAKAPPAKGRRPGTRPAARGKPAGRAGSAAPGAPRPARGRGGSTRPPSPED
jgi:DNA topoisomerase I